MMSNMPVVMHTPQVCFLLCLLCCVKDTTIPLLLHNPIPHPATPLSFSPTQEQDLSQMGYHGESPAEFVLQSPPQESFNPTQNLSFALDGSGPPTPPPHRHAGAALGRVSSAIDKSKMKTKICRNWSQGMNCAFGDMCAFAHGDVEKISTKKGNRNKNKNNNNNNNNNNSSSNNNGGNNSSSNNNANANNGNSGNASADRDAEKETGRQSVTNSPQHHAPIVVTEAATLMSTPIAPPMTPDTPAFAGFTASQLATPTFLDRTPQYADRTLQGAASSLACNNDSSFLRRGEAFSLEGGSPMLDAPLCARLGGLDTLSLGGGGIGASSVASSHYRYEPYAVQDSGCVAQVLVEPPVASAASAAAEAPAAAAAAPAAEAPCTPEEEEACGSIACHTPLRRSCSFHLEEEKENPTTHYLTPRGSSPMSRGKFDASPSEFHTTYAESDSENAETAAAYYD